jgi:hypothetical protein
VSAASILRSAFDDLNQHLRFVFLDVLWRSIWLACGFLALALFGFRVIGQLGAVEWNGPDLGAPSPIILLTALRAFWNEHGAVLLGELGLLILSGLAFWVVLEALFRGGRQGFWVYLGTSVGRLSLLGGAGAFFGLLALRDETWGTFLIGAVVLLGLWFMVSLLETAIRKDALVLIAVEFPKLLLVFGTLIGVEVFLAFILWGSAVASLKSTSGAAVAVVAVVVPFWMVLHSYLIAFRFSAIDIMRNAVGE